MNINIVLDYRIGILLGRKLVPFIVSVPYRVGSWSQVSYRYHIGWKTGLMYRIGIVSDWYIEMKLLLVSYRPAQNPVSPIPAQEFHSCLGLFGSETSGDYIYWPIGNRQPECVSLIWVIRFSFYRFLICLDPGNLWPEFSCIEIRFKFGQILYFAGLWDFHRMRSSQAN